MMFGHVISWNHEDDCGHQVFADVVIKRSWESRWDERVAEYARRGV